MSVDIIGPPHEDAGVHTIDMWYAAERRVWVVERISGRGLPIGLPHLARSKADALDCLHHWIAAHREAHLTAPRARRRPKSRARAAKLLR